MLISAFMVTYSLVELSTSDVYSYANHVRLGICSDWLKA